jgi:hypothetical protein
VVEKATPKQHAGLSTKKASAKKDTHKRSAQWNNDKAEKAQSLLQLLHIQRMKIVIVMKKTTKTKGFYEEFYGLLDIIPKR